MFGSDGAEKYMNLDKRASLCYDMDKQDRVWDFNKTFSRVEKYSENLTHSLLSRDIIENYIKQGYRFDKYNIDN
jgi:hypothetical protein